MSDIELAIIAAVAEDGTIGDEGAMPWYHPEDLDHFKRTTMGGVVILGRTTYESIVDRLGTALPGRTTIVLTRQPPSAVIDDDDVPADGDVFAADTIEGAIEAATDIASVAYVAGGATIYEQFLPLADRLIITEVPGEYDGDTRFPPVEWDAWTETSRAVEGELVFREYRREEDRVI